MGNTGRWKCGDEVEFGNLLGRAPVIDVGQVKSDDFINRGGYIPAPVIMGKLERKEKKREKNRTSYGKKSGFLIIETGRNESHKKVNNTK